MLRTRVPNIAVPAASPSITRWTPDDLAVLPVGWFEAATLNPTTGELTQGTNNGLITLNGSNVSAWLNKGSVATSANQATAANQPAYTNNGLNGRPALLFDGTADYLQLTNLLFSDPDQVFFIGVAKYNGSVSTILFGHRSESTRLIQITYQNVSTLLTQLRASNNVLIQPSATGTLTTEHIFENQLNNNGANSLHYSRLNAGTPVTDTTNFGTNTFTSTWQSIGATTTTGIASGLFGFFSGFLSEFIALNYIPTADEINQLQGYLAHKWFGAGAANTLPSGHVYKSSVPEVASGTAFTAAVNVTIPLPQIEATASSTVPAFTANVNATIPLPTIISTATRTVPAFNAAVNATIPLPAINAIASFVGLGYNANVNVTIPLPAISSTASSTVPNFAANVNVTVPLPLLNAIASITVPAFNANLNLTIPLPTISATASSTPPNQIKKIFTLSENQTILDANYLFVFTNRQTNEVIKLVKLNVQDLSINKDRYNEFDFTDFLGKGYFDYKVYEQESDTNIDVSLAGNLLEEGITYFKPTFEEFDNTWYSQTTYKTWI